MYKSLYLKIVAAILFVFIVVTIGYAEWKGMRNNNEIKIQHSSMQSSITEISKTQKIDISRWEIYHNEKYGFEIEYPNSFAVEEDASAQNIAIGGTMYSTQAKDPLTIEVIKPNTLQFSDFIEKVLTSSARIKSFSVHQQHDIIFSGRPAYAIDFIGGIDDGQSYFYFDQPVRVVFVHNAPYIVAIFIPQSDEVFSTIASTLTFLARSRR